MMKVSSILLLSSLSPALGRLGDQSEGLQIQRSALNETHGEAVNEVTIFRVCVFPAFILMHAHPY